MPPVPPPANIVAQTYNPPVIIPDAPIPPPVIPGAPVPPPINFSSSSGASLDLTSIGTVQLKQTERIAKPVDARSSLLESIKAKNIQLKSAKDRQLAEVKDEKPQTVAEILSRRIAIIGESSSEDLSEEEEQWD